MAPTIEELMQTHRYVFYLDENHPQFINGETVYPVSVVFEGVRGRCPTGGRGTVPWLWSKQVCQSKNNEMHSQDVQIQIMGSSMFPKT